jgi:hypothetical protein
METIEQRQKRETFKRFKQARTLYSFQEIGEKCGLSKQRIQQIDFDFKLNPRYNPHPRTLKKLNLGLDELHIPKTKEEE